MARSSPSTLNTAIGAPYSALASTRKASPSGMSSSLPTTIITPPFPTCFRCRNARRYQQQHDEAPAGRRQALRNGSCRTAAVESPSVTTESARFGREAVPSQVQSVDRAIAILYLLAEQ